MDSLLIKFKENNETRKLSHSQSCKFGREIYS